MLFKAEDADGDGTFSLTETTLAPGFPGPVPHRHARMVDSFYVLEGTLTVRLGDREIEALVREADAAAACQALIDAANARGTPDNLTAAVVRMIGPIPPRPRPSGLGGKLRQLVGALRSP